MELFPSIISRAKTLQVVHSEASGHASGSLHLVRFSSHKKLCIQKQNIYVARLITK